MSNWILPAAFAGLVAIAVTVIIERMGGKKGGLLGSLPTTIIPAAIGIFLASDTVAHFQDAMFITPTGMLANAIFLLLWRVVPAHLPNFHTHLRLCLCILITLLGWAILATVGIQTATTLQQAGIDLNYWAIAVTLIMGIVGIIACKKNPPAPKAGSHPGMIAIASRGVMAALAIGVSVWLAEHSEPLVAGIASVFPAIFLTAMCGLWLAHGESIGAGAVGPLMLGGTSVSAYAWLAAWTIPTMGLAWGSIAAWFTAVCIVTIPAWIWLNRVQSTPVTDLQ